LQKQKILNYLLNGVYDRLLKNYVINYRSAQFSLCCGKANA
jgi:hypothetical protein